MTGKPRSQPKEQFVKMPRDLLQSDAWRRLGIHDRRFLDYLMIEQMRFAGRQNGNLTAPHRRLIEFGISASSIAPTIRNLESCGLIRCQRRDAYSPFTYALTWLACCGTAPTNDWRRFRAPAPVPRKAVARSRDLAPAKSGGTSATGCGGTEMPDVESGTEKNQQVGRVVPPNVVAIYRSSYQGGLGISVESDDGTVSSKHAPPAGAPDAGKVGAR